VVHPEPETAMVVLPNPAPFTDGGGFSFTACQFCTVMRKESLARRKLGKLEEREWH